MSCFVRTMLAGGRKANARVALCWVRSVWNRFPAFTWSLVAVEALQLVEMPCPHGSAGAGPTEGAVPRARAGGASPPPDHRRPLHRCRLREPQPPDTAR